LRLVRQAVGHDGLDGRHVEERDGRQRWFDAVVVFAVEVVVGKVDFDVVEFVVFGGVSVVENKWVDFESKRVVSFFDDFDLCHDELQFVVVG